jgi:hypothetical protein
MLQVSNATQWWPPKDKEDGKARKGSPVAGVVYIPAKRVTDAARGIAYDTAGGWYAQTIAGNVQLAPGDWVVRCGSGHVYAIRQVDWWPKFGPAGLRAWLRSHFT